MAFQTLLNQAVDEAASLHPTRVFYIQKLTGNSHSSIFDFTEQLQASYFSHLDYNFLDSVQRVRRANLATPPIWLLSRERWYSNSNLVVSATNSSGGQTLLANWHSPITAMGTTRLSFNNETYSHHGIIVEPVAVMHRAQGFVKDSVPYLWETSLLRAEAKGAGRGTFSLFYSPSSSSTGKKVEIARYQSMSGKYEIGGVLILDESEISSLVAVLTLLAVLDQRDSFNNISAKRN